MSRSAWRRVARSVLTGIPLTPGLFTLIRSLDSSGRKLVDVRLQTCGSEHSAFSRMGRPRLKPASLASGRPSFYAAAHCHSNRYCVSSSKEAVPEKTAASPSCRVRESGMPPVEYWETLVDPGATLDRLGFTEGRHHVVAELGCGYGTFTIPVASRVRQLITFDIDGSMVHRTIQRATAQGLSNVQATVRDVVADGYGLEPESCDAVLLLNILHCEEPIEMLRSAAKLLKPETGRLYATHWQYDEKTPRGPPMSIRPHPEQIEEWAAATTLLKADLGPVACPPWHYGWVFRRI
eukprot:TRINITY_DN27225_c0_g1_i1.p1 TRINITY_DN27225_c0_g1~~TRINITY_DN27225_c0_g1_i1.p1  ORF type:complete len:293 (+),score=28.08 TRINITY_DN27225_c0_g1_i1:93-971(+)